MYKTNKIARTVFNSRKPFMESNLVKKKRRNLSLMFFYNHDFHWGVFTFYKTIGEGRGRYLLIVIIYVSYQSNS